MVKGEFVGFRALDEEARKLKEIKQRTGLSMSEILRSLVQSAVVEPVTAYRVVAKKNSGNGACTTITADSVRNS